ncbi:hypothetical protein [Bradyrhizobium sp. CCBAU 53340]|nr:hypothetical protein [Bradyrhizobium sp. CCBAU 53340]
MTQVNTKVNTQVDTHVNAALVASLAPWRGPTDSSLGDEPEFRPPD